MSYNWISAADAKGRERLKELLLTGKRIPVMVDIPIHGKFIAYARVWDNDTRRFSITARNWQQSYFTGNTAGIDGVEFLDLEPPKPQADEDGLLPCPFCGGKAEVDFVVDEYESWYKVGCKHDLCIGFAANHFMFRESDHAKHAWNRRT